MLNDAQMQWLLGQLAATAEVMGQAITPTAAAIMADDLSIYPSQSLERALKRVRGQHAGKLTLKAVLDQLEVLSGRLAPNEAWAQAMKSSDETATVLWSNEIQQAYGQSRAMLAGGDKVGARMAFIAAYERITASAREQRQLPKVMVSFGSCREQRQQVLSSAWQSGQISAPMAVVLALDNGVSLPAEVFNSQTLGQAVELGLITGEDAQDALNHGRLELAAPAFNPVALLAGRVEISKEAPVEMRERLGQLRDFFALRSKKRFTRQQVLARAARMELRRAKRASEQAVKTYQAGGAA